MKKFNLNKRIACFVSLALTSVIAFGTAMTAAAYVMIERHNQSITIDMDYSKYFGGGTGTEADPYMITNAVQLRNLSYLTNIGALNSSHYFRLSSFTYDTTPLIPIGNSDNPFRSHIDGIMNNDAKSATVANITNLLVTGDNISDVGMFGYVGGEAYIGHFILTKPTVNMSGETTFAFTTLDKNPLRGAFTEANIKGITFTENTYFTSGEPQSGITKFTIQLPNDLPKFTVVDGKNIPLIYSYSISNPAYASCSSTPQQIEAGTFVFDVLATDNGQGYDFKKNPGEYFTIEINVSGVNKITDASGNSVNRLGSFNLERYKLYYSDEKDFVVSDPGDPRCHNAMNYPKNRATKVPSGIETLSNKRVNYVGVVAGRLDGVAEWIGVSNPKMNIHRPFISYSLLVGKAIDDDNTRNLSREVADFSHHFDGQEGRASGLTLGDIPQYMTSFKDGSGNALKNYDIIEKVKTGGFLGGTKDVPIENKLVNNIYGGQYSFSEKAIDTLRIYGSNHKMKTLARSPYAKKGQPDNNSQGVKSGNPTAYVDEDGFYVSGKDGPVPLPDAQQNVEGTTLYYEKSLPSISIQNDISVEYRERKRNTGYMNVAVSNAIMFWVTAEKTKDWLQRILQNDFYLDFEIDYMYFDDDPEMANPGAVSKKRIDFMGGQKSQAPVDPGYFVDVIYKFDDMGSEGFYRYDYSTGTSYQTMAQVSTTNTSDPKSNKELFNFAQIDDPNLPGVPGQFPGIQERLLRFHHEDWAGPVAAADDPSLLVNKKVQTKMIRVKPFKGGGIEWSKLTSDAHNPIFFFGIYDEFRNDENGNDIYTSTYLPNTDPNNFERPKYRFDILGLRITISDIYGNMESSIGTIDFLENNASALPVSNGKFNHSKTKIKAQTINNISVGSAENTSDFVALYPEADNGSGGYKITDYNIVNVVRSGTGKVTVTWTCTGYSNSLKDIKPKNQMGFSEANIKGQ